MSHHHHHRAGFQLHLHRDKVRQRWKIWIMLAIGFVVVAVFMRLSMMG
jgi:hypothetical protein